MPIKTDKEIIEASMKEADSVETWALHFTASARDHEDWLKVIKYGIKFLKERPIFLLVLITKEADKRDMSSCDIMKEIGLRIAPEN